ILHIPALLVPGGNVAMVGAEHVIGRVAQAGAIDRVGRVADDRVHVLEGDSIFGGSGAEAMCDLVDTRIVRHDDGRPATDVIGQFGDALPFVSNAGINRAIHAEEIVHAGGEGVVDCIGHAAAGVALNVYGQVVVEDLVHRRRGEVLVDVEIRLGVQVIRELQ